MRKEKKKKTWFTSDHHFGHHNIIEYTNRPFESVTEMDEKLIKNWNEKVSQNDTVYYIGDFCFYKEHKKVSKLVNSLHGKKHLILGNHDEQFRPKAWVGAGFISVHTSLKVEISHQEIWMAHYPQDKGLLKINSGIFLHGHSHNNLPGIYLANDNQIVVNTCIENWNFAPLEVGDLLSAVAKFRESLSEGSHE